jgi:hypothetical protein
MRAMVLVAGPAATAVIAELSLGIAGGGVTVRRPCTYSSSKKPVLDGGREAWGGIKISLARCHASSIHAARGINDEWSRGRRSPAAARGVVLVAFFEVDSNGGSSGGRADDDIMKPCAVTVGEGVGPSPPPPHCSLPRTNLEPPGGLVGDVALRMSSVKFAFWPAMTLHWADS